MEEEKKITVILTAMLFLPRPLQRYFAMKYLQRKGFRVVPVNPVAAGQTILGEKV